METNRKSGRRSQARLNVAAAPKTPTNLLLILAVGLAAVCMLIAGLIWTWPAQAAVTSQQRAVVDQEIKDLAVQQAALKVDRDAAEEQVTTGTARVADLQQEQARLSGAQEPSDKLQALQVEIRLLEMKLATQSANNDQLARERRDAEGGAKLDPAVIQQVTGRLIKLANSNRAFICGVMVEGWYFTGYAQFPTRYVAYNDGVRLEEFRSVGRLQVRNRFISAARYDGVAPSSPGFQSQGFTRADFAVAPKNGLTVYCVCHQRVGDKELNNSVVSGVQAGEKIISGQRFLTTTLPARPEMVGAPVITADGKLIGILMPKMPGVEDLSLVLPAADLQ